MGLLGVVLVVAPLTVLLGAGDSVRGDDFDTRPLVFASDVPLAALLVASGPAVARQLRRLGGRLRERQWTLLAMATLAVVLLVALASHPSLDGALQVFRVFGALAVAGTVVEAIGRGWDSWRVVLAAAAGFQTVLAVAQVAVGGAVGLAVIGELADPFYPVGDVSAPSGTLLHPYVLAAHALVAAGVLAVRATRAPTTGTGVPWALAAAVAIAPVGFTYSRAAGLGAVALVAALAAGAVRQRARFALPALAMVLTLGMTAGLGADGWSGRVSQTTSAGTTADLTTGRGELIRQAADIIARYPVGGVGPGRYVESVPESAAGIRKPVHNVALLAAAEGGVLAGVAVVLVLILAGWAAFRGGWATIGLWLSFLPLLFLDHMAYTFPVGLVLLGVWAGAVDVWARSAPHVVAERAQTSEPHA